MTCFMLLRSAAIVEAAVALGEKLNELFFATCVVSVASPDAFGTGMVAKPPLLRFSMYSFGANVTGVAFTGQGTVWYPRQFPPFGPGMLLVLTTYSIAPL